MANQAKRLTARTMAVRAPHLWRRSPVRRRDSPVQIVRASLDETIYTVRVSDHSEEGVLSVMDSRSGAGITILICPVC